MYIEIILEMVLCNNGTFAAGYNRSSELRFIFLLRDKEKGVAKVLRYVFSKSKCEQKSVLPAEWFALMQVYGKECTIANYLSDRIRRKTNLTVYSATDWLHGAYILLAHTFERLLQIDLVIIRRTYERPDPTSAMRIKGKPKVWDSLKKVLEKWDATVGDMHKPIMLQAESFVHRDYT